MVGRRKRERVVLADEGIMLSHRFGRPSEKRTNDESSWRRGADGGPLSIWKEELKLGDEQVDRMRGGYTQTQEGRKEPRANHLDRGGFSIHLSLPELGKRQLCQREEKKGEAQPPDKRGGRASLLEREGLRGCVSTRNPPPEEEKTGSSLCLQKDDLSFLF